jgi:hypothetical protein
MCGKAESIVVPGSIQVLHGIRLEQPIVHRLKPFENMTDSFSPRQLMVRIAFAIPVVLQDRQKSVLNVDRKRDVNWLI